MHWVPKTFDGNPDNDIDSPSPTDLDDVEQTGQPNGVPDQVDTTARVFDQVYEPRSSRWATGRRCATAPAAPTPSSTAPR